MPSPKVETYDMQPEMSAYEVTDKVCDALENDKYDVIILNFANTDMVGHTGSLPAAIKAVETPNKNFKLKENGKLADLAPTMLDLMGINKPEEMTGESLLIRE